MSEHLYLTRPALGPPPRPQGVRATYVREMFVPIGSWEMCERCGCSRTAIERFGWKECIKPDDRRPETAAKGAYEEVKRMLQMFRDADELRGRDPTRVMPRDPDWLNARVRILLQSMPGLWGPFSVEPGCFIVDGHGNLYAEVKCTEPDAEERAQRIARALNAYEGRA